MRRISVLLCFLILGSTLYGQNDRTKRILDAVMSSSSETPTRPAERPVRVQPITKTERSEPQKQRQQPSQPAQPRQPQRPPQQQQHTKNNAEAPEQTTEKTAVAVTAHVNPYRDQRSQQRPLAQPSIDTIYLSTQYTTHMIFDTDINYADLSNLTELTGKVIPQAKNKLALKARVPFTTTASLSVEEANGTFRTFIIKYHPKPRFLIIDVREGADMWALARLDTITVSTLYTTHLLFASDVTYADISKPSDIVGKLVDQGKNKMALKARAGFSGTSNLSVEEANGVFHTYLVKFVENPDPRSLVKDTRNENKPIQGSLTGQTTRGTTSGSNVRNSASKSMDNGVFEGTQSNALKRADAPQLSEVIQYKQGLQHLSAKNYNIRFTCENIYSYSDIIYMTFRLDNGSGISYEVSDATFVVESNNGNKRKIISEDSIFPKNKFGGLTAQAKGSAKICYSFDKIALSSDQVLKVYLYENNGQRNLALTISYKDINNAIAPTRGK